jgi:hypothetical protein
LHPLESAAFSRRTPIAVDHDDNVVFGHGRLLACRLLGWTEVPTLRLDHLSPAQARAFMLADNRLAELADWDDRRLAQHLKELSQLVLDFSIEDTGFEIGEIDLRIASLDLMPGADDPADLLPELPAGPPISKIGDLWVLGRHRLLCGSALDAAAFAALTGEERAATVFTDPPYNVPIDGHTSGLGAIHHRPFPMACGEMGAAEFTAFLAAALGNLATFSVDGSVHFICMDWRHLEELLAASRNAYDGTLNLCVWTKTNAGMGSFYRSQHELVFVFKHGRRGHRNNVQLGRFGRHRSNVWTYPGPTRLRATAKRAISSPCILPSSRWRWSPMRSSTARRAATSCSMPLLAAARQSSPPSVPAGAATPSSLTQVIPIPPCAAGRR